MNYEQKYNEALERAMKLSIDGYLDAIAIDDIFPELAESEDERIRKELIDFVENWKIFNPDSALDDYAIYTSDSGECDKILAWLEKQGETFTKKDVDNAYLKGICDAKHELEKQGENSTNKIDRKFKVGDWIVNTNSGLIWKITYVRNYIYYIYDVNGNEGYETYDRLRDNYHLWTINDAKNGDVFVSGEVIFIFNKIHGMWVNCYCSLHKDDSFCEENYDLMHIKYAETIYPSTRKQRDTFFAKMKEAGYEWDAEKKELRKIESKTLNSDKEIEI